MLEPLLMSSFLLITFPISMYIMCVILCLFNALSLRVGALQISIIIIIITIIINISVDVVVVITLRKLCAEFHQVVTNVAVSLSDRSSTVGTATVF